MTTLQAVLTILIIALATFFIRAMPFVLFPPHRPTPDYVLYLGRVLPYAIMGMLIVYCLKDVQPLESPHGLPELLGVLAVSLLYLWRRNTLLAIAGGTLFYMVLVQRVFV